MHILFISGGDSKYGEAYSMKQLVKEVLKYNKDVKISIVLPMRIGYTDELAAYYRRLSCNVYKLFYEPFYQDFPDQKWKVPVKYIVRGMEYLIGRIFASYWLSKKIDVSTVDIIHSNSSREDLGAFLAIKYNKPLIWHIRELGLDCFSFRKNYIELMNEAATKIIAVSDVVREYWIKKGIDRNKIIRIYDGVDLMVRNDDRKDENDKIKFLMLGGISDMKGQYQVVQAFGLLSQQEKERCTLDFVGDGTKSYMKKMIKTVEKLGLSSTVRFLGYQKNFWKKIQNYDCGIMCSRAEGFGRVTAEYMMAGLPVIVSDTGANKELVLENQTGWLYQYNNISDLRSRIVFIINNINFAEQIGKRAKDYAYSHFSIKLHTELVYNEYLRVIDTSINKMYREQIK